MPLSYRAPLMFPSHCTVFHATSTYAVHAASQISPCLQSRRSWRWCRCACKRVVGASLRPAPTISAHARGARTTTGSASPRASLGQFSPASITRLCPSTSTLVASLEKAKRWRSCCPLEGDLASRLAPPHASLFRARPASSCARCQTFPGQGPLKRAVG